MKKIVFKYVDMMHILNSHEKSKGPFFQFHLSSNRCIKVPLMIYKLRIFIE